MNSTILSQTTNTQNIKCLNDKQVLEIFKGLKQNDYLKLRVNKTEVSLDNANQLIIQHKENSNIQENIIIEKGKVIENLNKQIKIENEISLAEKEKLENLMKFNELKYKSEGKAKFWKGFKWGSISVGVLGAALLILK